MHKKIIRPFNVGSAAVVLSSFSVFIFSFINLFSSRNLNQIFFNILLIIALTYVFIVAIFITFSPKTVLLEDRMIVYHWENGTPYNYGRDFPATQFIKFPKVKISTIYYKDLMLYGAYTIGDITEYTNKDSGFLKQQWIVARGGNVFVPIKLPKIISKLRGVLLFVNKDGESVVVDGKAYSVRQTAGILATIENHITTKSGGIIDPDHKYKQVFVFDVLTAIAMLIVSVIWCVIIPVSLVWIEGILNVSHPPNYQSPLRVLYIIGFMLANLSLIGVIISKRKENSGDDAQRVAKVFKFGVTILYPIAILAFAVSVF